MYEPQAPGENGPYSMSEATEVTMKPDSRIIAPESMPRSSTPTSMLHGHSRSKALSLKPSPRKQRTKSSSLPGLQEMGQSNPIPLISTPALSRLQRHSRPMMRAPPTHSTWSTRSNCRYHRISLPKGANDQDHVSASLFQHVPWSTLN